MTATQPRDHGGGLDAAMAKHGGARSDWLDISTGINPVPYPLPEFQSSAWTNLPDENAMLALNQAAREFWSVPDGASILAAPGTSSLIARIPTICKTGTVSIPGPTYNEHSAAFSACGWETTAGSADAKVVVHPNNPDGLLRDASDLDAHLNIIDESFCDVVPDQSLVRIADRRGVLILKSFGKFWGHAGLRLGFAIGDPELIQKLADTLGPWPVSGPALAVGTSALNNHEWAIQTRKRLADDSERLDNLMCASGAEIQGGTTLFRLYNVNDAAEWQTRLAAHHIWTRIFPYSKHWIRLGMPSPDRWQQLERAL